MPENENSDIDKLVGKNVQTFRVSAGLSQAELAAAISTEAERIPQQTIVKIEKGTRPLRYAEAVRVSRALRIGIADLIKGDVGQQSDYLAHVSRLSALQDEMPHQSQQIASELVDLALRMASDPRPDGIPEKARGWLEANWGDALNAFVVIGIRSDPRIAANDRYREYVITPDTYAEVLRDISGGGPDGPDA